MKLISFDIGIKNMAYCIFDISGKNIEIIGWDVLNMIQSEENEKFYCNCLNKAKNKKTPAKICGKSAIYKKNGIFYCSKHSKSNSDFLIPDKKFSVPSLKKLKNEDLINICNEYKIMNDEEKQTIKLKQDILHKMFSFFDEKCLVPIINKKVKSAKEVDLIIIGKNMKKLLNDIDVLDNITNVVIENQISPIANRMKTIQGMLAQYFIMKNDSIEIDFVSSSNKLRSFEKKENILKETHINESDRELIQNNQNTAYKQHKKDSITYCSQLLENNLSFHKWKHILDNKKKDDLADCFLQGIWYINK